MKKYLVIVLLLAAASASADEVADRIAQQRSLLIVNLIKSGETTLKKAIEYDDERGYENHVQSRLRHQVQWWRETQNESPEAFEPYKPCLSAGVEFLQYGGIIWEEQSLDRDDEQKRLKQNYHDDEKVCREYIHAHPVKPSFDR